MRILHYSLGFPPYRSGGLTKFCMDLMNEQIREGHSVSLLWPGQMIGKRPHIKARHPVYGIKSYELINPLPVSLDEGILDIEAFTRSAGKKGFYYFLKQLRPDVIHIHTLMGLYDSFLVAARRLGIRLVFTSHDFFPICPKVTMYRHGRICEYAKTCEQCPECNSSALSLWKIRILQSLPYRMLKESKVVKRLRKRHRDNYLNEEVVETDNPARSSEDYKALRAYYAGMLKKVNLIHFNSSIASKAYKDLIKIRSSKIVSITHSSVGDHRKRRQYGDDQLRIRYLGPQGGVKGFFLLKDALDELWKERQDFCLDIHFVPVDPSPYMRVHDRYTYDELEKIFDETDLVVAPSLWYETFGFTVLESLSFGVPVIISGTVGAKDILAQGAGIVIEDITADKLRDAINGLTPESLYGMNQAILKKQHIMTIREMSEMIMKECYMEG